MVQPFSALTLSGFRERTVINLRPGPLSGGVSLTLVKPLGFDGAQAAALVLVLLSFAVAQPDPVMGTDRREKLRRSTA
ncbi:MAG: hypothetical protein ACK4F5_17755 [Aliihoeflea sp.]